MFIRLDKKGRLVLPVEIRDALGLEKGEELQLLFESKGTSVSATLSRPGRASSRSISKNTKEVKI